MNIEKGNPRDFENANECDELAVGEIRAYRKFRIQKRGTYVNLVGLAFPQPVDSGVNYAPCYRHHSGEAKNHSSRTPDPNCTCGFYGYDSYRQWPTPRFSTALIVDAVVKFSGKIIVCERGLRAEKMEVEAISEPKKGMNTEESLNFNILKLSFPNVEFYDSAKEMLENHPLTPVERQETDDKKIFLQDLKYSFRRFSSFAFVLMLAIFVFSIPHISESPNSEPFALGFIAVSSIIPFVSKGIRLMHLVFGAILLTVFMDHSDWLVGSVNSILPSNFGINSVVCAIMIALFWIVAFALKFKRTVKSLKAQYTMIDNFWDKERYLNWNEARD